MRRIGAPNFAEATTKQFSVSQSWAKSRILIDGETVFDESNKSSTFSHSFAPGEHIVEVEYINNWHTVEYKVTIEDAVDRIAQSQVAERLRAERGEGANLYYVGLYESGARDTAVTVNVPRTGKPAVLWLSSYEAIDWNIDAGDEIAAVLVSSYSPGSRVRGEGVKRVAHVDGKIAIYGETKRCSCAGGMYHCEGDSDVEDVAQKLYALTNMHLAGYATDYSAAAVTIRPYAESVVSRMREQRATEEAARAQCVGNANPNFDTLMNR